MFSTQSEAKAVAERYARRRESGIYSMLRPEVWKSFQERQREILLLLRRHSRKPPEELQVLEIGCGTGSNLVELIRIGFNPANLVANELLPERAAAARVNLPSACRVIEGDATSLKLPEMSFDIVYQSTVFTSLLDPDFQQRLAACMWKWLRPGGGVLWYDFVYDNPSNPDVRGVPLKRVRELFPDGTLSFKRVTLAPPISRRVCRIHHRAYDIFNAVPLLRTHLLCWIGKPDPT